MEQKIVENPDTTYVTIKRGDGKEELISVANLAKIAERQSTPRHSKKNVKFTNAPISLSSAPSQVPSKKGSVIVNAKVGSSSKNAGVEIYINVTDVEIDGTLEKRYVVSRNRDGSVDQSMNFGFDRSFSYHHGEAAGKKWYKKNQLFTAGGVNAKRWITLVPTDCYEVLIQGLKENFSGATLVECLENEEVRSVL